MSPLNLTKKDIGWMIKHNPYDFMTYYTYRLIKREKARVSAGNGFYDWTLSNWDIAKAYIDLEENAELFCRRKIDRNAFVAAIHIYFEVVHAETLAAWMEKWNPLLKNLPERGEAFKLPIKELEFINNRFHAWVKDEKYGYLELDLDNKIPEESLEHVQVGGITKDHVITWGKYKLQRYTIQGLIDRDPQWLLWAVTNTDKLKVSDEIMQEILRAQGER
jgi:hypothetical protein